MPALKSERLTNVTNDRLGAVVESFARSGAKEIQLQRNVDGTWTVEASFGGKNY